MNYHIEGVFHAEKQEGIRDWFVWSDLSILQVRNVTGVNKVTKYAGKYGVYVHIDPRHTEEKVISNLMELARQKHSKSECTCTHYHTHRNGDIEHFHFGDCPCRSLDDEHPMDITSAMFGHMGTIMPCGMSVSLSEMGKCCRAIPVSVDKDQVKVITYNGKLYYVEGEVGPNYVAVKKKDLDDLEDNLDCAVLRLNKHRHDCHLGPHISYETFDSGFRFLGHAQDLLGDIIQGDTECAEADPEQVLVKRKDLEEWVEEIVLIQSNACSIRSRSLFGDSVDLLDSIVDSAFRAGRAIRGVLGS